MGNYSSIPGSQLKTDLAIEDNDYFFGIDSSDFSSGSTTGTTKKFLVSDLNDFIISREIGSNIQSVKASCTANLTAIYYNGVNGIGATLTNSGAQAQFSADGILCYVGDRVLVQNQSISSQNGIYVVTNPGTISSNYVLTRASDYDGHLPNQIVYGDFVGVIEGVTFAKTFWFMTSNTPLNVGIDSIFFEQSSMSSPTTPFVIVTSASQSMSPNTNYMIKHSGLCSLLLPSSASVGDKIFIQGVGPGLFSIIQNSGQQVFFPPSSTSVGVSGHIDSTIDLNSIEILCVVANTTWVVSSGPLGLFDVY